jgi:hypothetical protein
MDSSTGFSSFDRNRIADGSHGVCVPSLSTDLLAKFFFSHYLFIKIRARTRVPGTLSIII